jgi:hypothetical protein
MESTMQPKMTRHAKQRLQQRGARAKDVAIVMAYGDIEVPAKHGCRFLRLSHSTAASLLRSDRFAVQEVDRARRLMVLADSSDQVITLIKCEPERRFGGARRGGY